MPRRGRVRHVDSVCVCVSEWKMACVHVCVCVRALRSLPTEVLEWTCEEPSAEEVGFILDRKICIRRVIWFGILLEAVKRALVQVGYMCLL